MTGQRWVPVVSQVVTAAVLQHRDDPAFTRRFTDKIDVGFDLDDCHIWTGALSDEGYGTFRVLRHNVRAHRVAWLLRFGDNIGDLFLDHVTELCQGRFCVNTDHLEPVTNQENLRRKTGSGKLNQRALRSALLIDRRQIRETEVF